MQLIINGEPRVMEQGSTVSALLAELALDGRRLGVEVNRSIIPKSAYAATLLNDGDTVEIVHFVGGG